MKPLFSIAAAAALTLSSWVSADPLEVGYMPILPVAQLFVGVEQGALTTLAPDAKLIQFQNGPAMVQALLGGQLDIAYLGIGPAMVARAKGADIKVVASNIVEQISFVAQPELVAAFASGDRAGAFARFTETHGRAPIIATFPRGSVPETVLQYWLQNGLGIDDSGIQIVHQGAAAVQQSLLTGAVDGAAILEPVVSTTLARVKGAEVIAAGAELFPNQPGAVLVVREGLIAANPALVRAWVADHAAATEALRNDPAAANAVQKYVGGGRLPMALVETALVRSQASFVADPRAIVDGTRVMHDFQASQGTLKAKVDLDALFDLQFYPAP
ncbi:ABC transporter substrate-binding protein [Litorivicinus lipolyticus]|uniref:ABC transporter substrate-binding protein n=1 Tax=Litorivicinus lipolyticus TaxID=418701 RepID=UPI003B5A095C